MLDPDSGLSLTIARIVQRLKGSSLHSQLERQARVSLHKPEIKLESLKEDIRDFLKTSGWEKKLQNAVYSELNVELLIRLPGGRSCIYMLARWKGEFHNRFPSPCHPAAPPEHMKEPLAYMRKAQGSWEKRILKSLNSMCTELGIPLAQKRPVSEQKELLNKWNEMGTDEPDLSLFRPVYAPKDFLEVLMNLRNPNYENGEQSSFRNHLGLIQVPLKVKDIPELKEDFSELGLNIGQLGIDDSAQVPPDFFENEHVRVGQKVLAEQDSAAAQQYVRQGCPTALRADLWALILNISNQPEDILYYEQLKSNVIQHDLLVDSLIYKDVKLTASNDDYYFVFEDYLYQVLLCFSRDTSVLEHFTYSSATPPKSYIRGKVGMEEYAVFYPPNGVIPFHGFSMYVAPLCFLYHEPSKLYQIFREMYVRFFFRLHSISSHPSGIVSLCLLFETLLQTHLPQLFYHLREIGAQPLRISFKWMVRAFSGYLATDQLLLLWDRILGYNSLEILAVLAAAVFAFRAVNLMEVTSLAAAELMEKTDREYYTLDDMFVSKAAKRARSGEEEEIQRRKAIQEHQQLAARMEKCPYCFDSSELSKHLIIAIGTKVYLSLPSNQSLTEGHCLIAPLQHHTAATLLDEDIWEEIQMFRNALVKMFEAKDLDCVFLETNMSVKKRYHMVYECIPLPKEVGDVAPIYFKKAIMESDEEWSVNKKLIDLSSKDIRKSVPKGLPYFSVDFGLQGGFAHVIEDQHKFPHYFGKEIIGGMLDLEPRLWRKGIRQNFEDQRKKVLQFAQWWKPYDFTKMKE